MKRSIKNFVSEEIESLIPYPPGKPIEEVEREYGIKGSIKLASNENPLGPSPMALDAIRKGLNKLHRYPDGSCYYLKQKLARALGVKTGMIIVGNGSNEIIELLTRTFLKPGEEAIMGDPSFAVYPIIVKATRGRAVKIPLRGLTHDLVTMRAAVTDRTRLIFIANPNNPTGTIVVRGELESFLGALPDGVITVLDEAYHEYVTDREYPEGIAYVKRGMGIIVLRTFSKIYGLAGLRIGYGLGSEEIVSYMERVRQPFNVNSLAQLAAMAALDDEAHLKRSRENNINGMKYLFRELAIMGLECVPSQANFFLVKVGRGRLVYEELLKSGVIVRPMDSYGMPEYIRVTVGLPVENERFIDTFKAVSGALKIKSKCELQDG